ncbi:MAG: hypothetical protein L0Z49_02600, partial [Actinobacteria bacterium]|nr:hypothetical protein [Actinomycetota bacterium]
AFAILLIYAVPRLSTAKIEQARADGVAARGVRSSTRVGRALSVSTDSLTSLSYRTGRSDVRRHR